MRLLEISPEIKGPEPFQESVDVDLQAEGDR